MSERLRLAEVERDAALAELHHVADHLGTVRHDLAAALARIARLEAALRPFAEWHDTLLPGEVGPIYAACGDAAAALTDAPGEMP